MSFRLALLAALLLGPACGGDDDSMGDDDDSTADAGNPGDPDAFVPPAGSYTIDWGPLTIQPGDEDTKCVTKRLGNPEPLKAHTIRNVLGDVSHHFIVYKVADTTERPDPYPCTPFVDTLNPASGAPLMITQKFEETLTLPDGVAFVLDADQMIRLELHYINTGDAPAEAHPTATFSPIPEAEFENAADILFMGDIDVDVPAMSTATLGPTYIPMPGDLAGSSFFAITGHEHRWGTNVVVDTAMNQTTVVDTVYDLPNFDWDEPETVRFDPPFAVPSGGGFRITCEWNNTSGQSASFGESATDEMCFFWSYYFPSQGPRICFQTDQFGGMTGCCPGHPACGFI
jgi:hypothetical protein